MKRVKWSPAEAYWHFHIAVAFEDFLRALRDIQVGNFTHAAFCLYFADMLDEPFSLEGL